MKKIFLGIIPFIMFFTTCAGSPTPAADSGGMTLDQAIAEAAVRIDERITAGSKIAPLNFNSSSERFSTYVLDELTANLVDSGKLIVVDRSEIDLIRKEFDFQYTGEVADDSMQELGRMLGAQSIISGSLTDMGGFYRIVIRVLNVQNASVEVQYRANIISDRVMAALLPGSGTSATTAASGRSGTATSATSAAATGSNSPGTGTSSAPQPSTVTVDSASTPAPTASAPVIVIEGRASPAEKLEWLQTNARNRTEYVIILDSNVSMGPLELTLAGRSNVTLRLTGAGSEKTISLSGRGSLFTIGTGITLVLDNNITLQGRADNNAALVTVNGGGTLIMRDGAKIQGNSSTSSGGSGGVTIKSNGIFTIEGGTISGNTGYFGGAVFIEYNASFRMRGGEISGNTVVNSGGGVYILGSLVMTGGKISANISNSSTAYSGGGGVRIDNGGQFRMEGGIISDNTTLGVGGGVYMLSNSSFTMTGGEIAGNRATSGGGVFLDTGSLAKTGGTIYGYTEGDINSNMAMQGIANRNAGHAVFNYNRRRESTAGPNVRLDSTTNANWEN